MSSFFKRLIAAILSSIFVSFIIFIASYSLMTHQFPPNLLQLKETYSILSQLNTLNGQNYKSTSAVNPFRLEHSEQGAVTNRLKAIEDIDRQAYVEPTTVNNGVMQPQAGPLPRLTPERIRAEREKSRLAFQAAQQTQYLRDEISKLKLENAALRKKLETMVRR